MTLLLSNLNIKITLCKIIFWLNDGGQHDFYCFILLKCINVREHSVKMAPYVLFSHIYLISSEWERPLWMSKHNKFLDVYLCLWSGDLFIFLGFPLFNPIFLFSILWHFSFPHKEYLVIQISILVFNIFVS